MAEVSTIAAVIATIAAAAGCAVAGVALRRRQIKRAAAVDWIINVGGQSYRVVGPYRGGDGKIRAMRQFMQKAWAESLGGRLPRLAEADAIWATADVRVLPHTYPGGVGPLTSLDDDARRAGAKVTDRIAAGKHWIDAAAVTNYGFFVPKSQVTFSADLGHMAWKGIKAYPSSTMPDAWYVLQSPGTDHNDQHVDYSQAGYAVIPIGPS